MATRAQQARAAKLTPAEQAASKIRKGEMDSEMELLVNAISERVMEGAVALRWRVDLDGIEASEDDLTLGEAEMLERLLKVRWGEMDPLTSAEHATALLVVILSERQGLPVDEARARVGKYTARQVLSAITRYSVEDPPKD